ncbi:MAG TPA: glycosyltransferase family 2 protein [Candidatus Saccharimonadales bacterium]|nr:glycosyltransferase family 2 protein [Candidatus Saccharimonadales bacterium]
MAKQQLVSIIVPMHNEALNIQPLYTELNRSIKDLAYKFEMIFVDDGSSDDTIDQVERLAKKDKRIRLIEFARNFGKEPAISAGLHAAKGDAAIMLDADLQHPPSLIGSFIDKWQQGAEVVVGVKEYDKSERWLKKWCSARFYSIMQGVAHTRITPHASDYRLVDRKVIREFRNMPEKNRITRGIIDWLGFKRSYIHFKAGLRNAGEASYTFSSLIRLALNSLTSYSLLPLQLAGYLGISILLLATPIGAFLAAETYLLGDPFGWEITGTAMLAIMILVLVGLILACIGLVALYIAHIHAEVTNRPLYIVRRKLEELEPVDTNLRYIEGEVA